MVERGQVILLYSDLPERERLATCSLPAEKVVKEVIDEY
jgi:hypothetical protein